MRVRSLSGSATIIGLALSLVLKPASAGIVEDAAYGLGYIGFDIIGDNNPLSGGIDLLVTNNFFGNPLDFGLSELTLQGPISLEINTGGHLYPELDIAFRTALNGDSAAAPLNFNFASDLGALETNVDGSLFIDTKLKINRLGFYDLTLQSSTRSTVEQTRRSGTEVQQFDSDVGPIGLSGNAVLDVLAVLTQPVFERSGSTNPFVVLSGPNSLSNALLNPNDADQARLASGSDPLVEARRIPIFAASFQSVAQRPLFGPNPGNHNGQSNASGGQNQGHVVPEPTVLLLMLAGIPALLGLRRRRTG